MKRGREVDTHTHTHILLPYPMLKKKKKKSHTHSKATLLSAYSHINNYQCPGDPIYIST